MANILQVTLKDNEAFDIADCSLALPIAGVIANQGTVSIYLTLPQSVIWLGSLRICKATAVIFLSKEGRKLSAAFNVKQPGNDVSMSLEVYLIETINSESKYVWQSEQQ